MTCYNGSPCNWQAFGAQPIEMNGPYGALTSRGGNKREAPCYTCQNPYPLINVLISHSKDLKVQNSQWTFDLPTILTALFSQAVKDSNFVHSNFGPVLSHHSCLPVLFNIYLCIFVSLSLSLFQCFGSDGKLVLHYCKSQAWG